MEVKPSSIPAPSKKERLTLRAMIFVGLFAVAFFLYTISKAANIGYTPLYVLLIITILYYCLKYLHEWYHYFSISVPTKPQSQRQYTVDILTTYCAGEPFEMLEETLTAIQKITYPHTTWCCDEADDAAVKALCKKLDVQHVTRTVKKDAKAGNINNALQYATGELCVVMDPDHVPCPEMLDYVVPYFEDEKIGFVQIVQAYYNQRESLVAKGAAQQTYQFYGPMMMCMNTYGTVQAIGANCTFRRKALDSIGGHAAGLAEDMHTAMQIHAKGWKSIYVPATLTRGLVPATLSSYFKQQLKWSRGTWDLLLYTYPKLFSKFTWRQKLHYFMLPFHYLSGIIFFINFLIPVISLFTGYIPLRMDIVSFTLAAVPVLSMAVFIRHYVQKWVADEDERGFHIVGGILQIGAWWIHSIGFVYTLFRKKVPYIPTPKNDKDPLPLILNTPNIIIAAISLAAILYGFTYNYNPYTLFMAILASMQIIFMFFIFSVSGYTTEGSKVESIAKKVRSNTWIIIKAHGFIRNYSVALSLMLVTIFIVAYKQVKKLPTFLPKPIPGLQVFYKGIYQPGFAANQNNAGIALDNSKNDFSIFSFDLLADSTGKAVLPREAMMEVYSNKTIPLINWYALNNKDSLNNSLFESIRSGSYDDKIKLFAIELAQLKKPLFLAPKFSHVYNDNLYQNIDQDIYKDAWKHVHSIFDSAGANKIIWVWNPVSPSVTEDFYPGSRYTDWLSIDLPDTSFLTDSLNNSFYRQYQLYHNTSVFQGGNPVIVNKTGAGNLDDVNWWKAMEDNIDTTFKEIKAVIISNTAGKNMNSTGSIKPFLTAFKNSSIENGLTEPSLAITAVSSSKKYQLPGDLRGVLYDKGYHWFRNRHTMTAKLLEEDIQAMKKIGINTVERTMPGFYDDILDRLLTKHSIYQIGRLSIRPEPAMIEDKEKASQEMHRILKTVRANRNKKNIIAWNLGDDILFNLETETYKPEFFYYRNLYLLWLANLCKEIRKIDDQRTLLIDLNWDNKGDQRFELYRKYVPDLNTCMLTGNTKFKKGLQQPLKEGMAWGKVPADLWELLPGIKKSGFIPAWQDIENTDFVMLNGLLDLDGRKKDWYSIVANTWGNMHLNPDEIPTIKILRPLQSTLVNAKLTYGILLRPDSTHWDINGSKYNDIRFEWYLVRVDQYGTTMFIKKIAQGPYMQLTIPDEPKYYELYVEAIKGDNVKMTRATLNTPLR